MKKALFFILLLPFFNSYAQLVRPCGDEEIYSTTTTSNQLNSICFATNDTVWAVGTNGTILKSTDAGVTWSKLPKNSFYEYNSVWFTSKDTGYIAGDGSNYGVMLKTVDGGQNWVTQFYGNLTYNMSFSLWFNNKNEGFVGQSSRVAKTTDGGTTWAVKTCGTGVITDLHFVNKDTGFAVNGNYIYKTQNGGNTWSQVFNNSTINFNAISFPNKDTGYVGSLGGEIYRTTNGGATWAMLMDVNKAIRDIDFISKDTGYISTSGGSGYGYVMKTYDKGTTWTGNLFYINNQDLDLRSMAVNKNGRWLAVSKYGDIISSDDQGATWVNRKIPLLQGNFFLTKSNRNRYYFGAFDGKIYSTANSGLTFTSTTVSTNTVGFSVSQLAWPYKDTAYVFGQASSTNFFKRTFNGGLTWQNISAYGGSQLPVTISNLSFPTKDKGFLSAYRYVYSTNNAGNTWTQTLAGDTNVIRDLYIMNKDTGYACGNNGKIAITTDGGATWILKPSGIPNHLMNIYFINGQKGFVGSIVGKVYMTVDGGTTWTQQANYSSSYIADIQFVNSKVGYLNTYDAGLTSTVQKTINGGLTWKMWDYSYFYNNITRLSAINEDTIWATVGGNLTKIVDRYPAPPPINLSYCDSGNVNLSLTPVNQYPYNWYYDKDGNNFAFTGNSYVANSLTQSDTLYYAIADSLYYCESKKSPVYITITPTPGKPVLNYVSDTTLCYGQTLSLQPTTSHQTVTWNNGANTNALNVSQSGYYFVTVSDNGCTSSSSDSIGITINALLPQPTIVNGNQDTLLSDQSGYHYNWYLNGVLLADTTQYIVPVGFGDYTNSITDSLGCTSPLSSPYHYSVVTGIKYAGPESRFSLSPNPNDGNSLTVSCNEEIKRIEIYTSIGKQVYSKAVNDKNVKLAIDLPDGSYYITVIAAVSKSSKPFIVSNH